MKQEEVQKTVRERYGKIANESTAGSCACGGPDPKLRISPCCGNAPAAVGEISKKVGYSEEEIKAVPEGANLGLGCGNPIALASLKEGETVLDLGSGGGFDCFLASEKVGVKGKVIGVDMTAEMLDKARENARRGKYQNVEFRLGEIENLPVADNMVDAIISNCVINLSNDKPRVFAEAFRVLKPGGRLMVSDIVVLKKLPEYIRESIDAYIGCVSGEITKTKYIKAIKAAGFEKVKIVSEDTYPLDLFLDDPTATSIMADLKITSEQAKALSASIASVKVQGIKPIQAVRI
jgi:ubiquinone/menaquinone biosynthesis C-methylase UbiE